jgi:hypothetical protein
MFARPSLPERMSGDPIFAEAIESSHQFLSLWFYIWTMWLVFYAILSFHLFQPNADVRTAQDACNLINAALLFLAYQTMVRPSTGAFRPGYHQDIVRVLVVCAIVIAAEFAATRLFSDHVAAVRNWFDAFNGVVSGVSLALVIGRLESRLIGVSIYILLILYTWAIIQFGYVLFSQPDDTSILVLVSIALVGKVVLFDEINRISSTGILTYYMAQYRVMFSDDKAREEFLKRLLMKAA